MELNEEAKQKLETAYNQIEMHLEEGVSYYSTYTVTTYGAAGGRVFSLENDLRVYLDHEKQEHLDLFKVTKSFPAYTIVKYTFIKGSPVTVEACSPEMLLHEMKLELKARQMQHAEILRVTNSPAEGLLNIETRVKFLKNGKMDILEKEIGSNGSVSEELYSCIEDEMQALYHALDGNLKKMVVSMTSNELIVQTTPAIPGLTDEIIEQKADLKLDASNLKAIYTFLESHDEAKIAKGLEVLENNPEFKELAEKRYLNFIRARLNNVHAVLAQFQEAALSRSEVSTLTGKHFAKDFISFSYFDDSESKLAVDFIGSMVRNAIDLESYADQVNQLSDLSELIALYDKFAAQAKHAITAEAKIHPKGWYSEISKHLIQLKLKRVLFEKTQFDEANRSLVLKEFIFFLNIQCKTSVYLDIFQSDTPKLTEMFWQTKAVPESSWGDVVPKFPDSPLKFQRSASYRIGDEGDWEMISKP
ncbi:hypothetical protein [Fluviicola sp.]|uniref:hypothetical protein n=1 Tax=Fluviicola sp. TaxID=1917219 RepID=UPI002617D1E2|nr:hypothetical protein [Fluviicola sp.]